MRSLHIKRRSPSGGLGLEALGILVSLALLASSCATSGYWIPPNSPPTNAPDISFLFGTPLPPTEPEPGEPTEPAPDIIPTQAQVADPVQAAPTAESLPTPTTPEINTAPILYYTQAADTLPVVAVRFGIHPQEITSPDPIPDGALLPPNQLLIIPRRQMNTTSSSACCQTVRWSIPRRRSTSMSQLLPKKRAVT